MKREAITGSNLSAKTAILTPRQREIFEFVKQNIMNRGYGPTVREIGNEFGIKSPNGVMCHLKALEKKQLIKREANLSRAMELCDKPQRKTALELRGTFSQGGKLKDNKADDDQVDFLDVLGGGDHYCYRVSDDGLKDEGINKGDYVVCRQQQFYRDNDRVLAVMDNKETVYRRIFQDGLKFRMEAVSGPKKPVYCENPNVLGMVIGLIRKL